MDELETLKLLIDYKPLTEDDLAQIKREIAKKNKTGLSLNSDLLALYHKFLKKGKISENKNLALLLRTKKIRSLSGVAVITIATKPYPCPGNCLYCPSQKNMPKSYLKDEPAIMRAIRNKFDPYRQTQERIKTLEKNGHPADKIELIVIGGTWSYLPYKYQEWFIKRAFDACNNKTSETLSLAQKINEKAKHRMIGLTVETRPDYIDEKEILRLRYLGVTRVEMGVQSIYDSVLKINRRGHKIDAVVRATQLLKDAGFKICYHMMPNLLGSNLKMDLQMFKEIFLNENFQPDMLKIYPCVVVPEASLYQWYLKGKYKPYNEKELFKLISKIILTIPEYCRLQRVIRDIPSNDIAAGSKTSNLNEIIQRDLLKQGLKSKDIRSREVQDQYLTKEKIYLFKTEYLASGGKEIFLSYENKDRSKLYSLLRLRIPSNHFNHLEKTISPLKNAALIREVHTYGQLVPLKHQEKAAQHQGLGKKLMLLAEQIARKEFHIKKMVVISGIGVRQYYRHLGYHLEKTYMVKRI